jgi:8-amino-7-oxononanoate synthase
LNDLAELVAWYGDRAADVGTTVLSLPDPEFHTLSGCVVSFSTNNYLAIASSSRMKAAAKLAIDTYGVGNCESRLLSGNLSIYSALEDRLARSKGLPNALLFATGYLANLGALSTLPRAAHYAKALGFDPASLSTYAYFSDQLNHVSIKEGIRASGARRHSYRHLDVNHLETLIKRSDATNKIIVTDGVFSQDGDIAPIPDLLGLAERYDAYLYIDDAHGTGVLGASGKGILEHFGVANERIIYMGTLSKAYGAIGGFVAASPHIIEVLRLLCPTHGFTSTLPPDQVLAVDTAMDIVADEPERRDRLWANQRYLLQKLSRLPCRIISSDTPIVPLAIGNDVDAIRLTLDLRERGFHVDAIKFPAVPLGGARIRLQLNAEHTSHQIDELVAALDDNRPLLEAGCLPCASHTDPQMATVLSG